jgi:hypothetical protein
MQKSKLRIARMMTRNNVVGMRFFLAAVFCTLLYMGSCQTNPPTPLGIVVLCINRSIPYPSRFDNLLPRTGDQLRYQILIYTQEGWYTKGSYNPRRISGVYFDLSGWSVVAVGGAAVSAVPPPSLPRYANEWRWGSSRISWTLSGRHIVDRERTFSSVWTNDERRYYMYEINQDGDGWYRELFYTGPGMRIIAVRFELTVHGRGYRFYAGPPPGVRASELGRQSFGAYWNSIYNQYVYYLRAGGYDLSGWSTTNGRTADAGFEPIFVRPGQRFLNQIDLAPISSVQAREFAYLAMSMIGIPYEWGGKHYQLRASDVAYDPRDQDGSHGFGLDCSGFVYVALEMTNRIYGYYAWIRQENRMYFGVNRVMALSDPLPSGQHGYLALGDVFCRPSSRNHPPHVAIYIGRGAMYQRYVGYRVVECASDGEVEGAVMRDLRNASTYHPRRLRL